MILFDSITRLRTYFRRHGVKATLDRALLSVWRSIMASRMCVFYCDLTQTVNSPSATFLPAHVKVERKDTFEQIDPQDWQAMVNFWNPELTSRLFVERLHGGASIWMIRSAGKLAGYGWSMTGHTIAPHYCPFGADDVHFFDFLVFPEFRGQQFNPALVNYMLGQFAAEGRTRAYIEAAEWNLPQLNSLRKTNFRSLGIARKTSLFGRTFVQWTKIERTMTQSSSAPREQEPKSAIAMVNGTQAASNLRRVTHS